MNIKPFSRNIDYDNFSKNLSDATRIDSCTFLKKKYQKPIEFKQKMFQKHHNFAVIEGLVKHICIYIWVILKFWLFKNNYI